MAVRFRVFYFIYKVQRNASAQSEVASRGVDDRNTHSDVIAADKPASCA